MCILGWHLLWARVSVLWLPALGHLGQTALSLTFGDIFQAEDRAPGSLPLGQQGLREAPGRECQAWGLAQAPARAGESAPRPISSPPVRLWFPETALRSSDRALFRVLTLQGEAKA